MDLTTAGPLVVALGRREDGVTAHALESAAAAGAPAVHVDLPPALAAEGLARALAPVDPARPLHLHVTDRQLGGGPRAAADALVAALGGRTVLVTLHDVPQPAEGTRRARERTDFYRAVAGRAEVVVVSSEHERALCGEIGVAVDAVIPLPFPELPGVATAAPRTAAGPADSLGVFGFLHPGKAVDLLVDELCRLPRPPALRLLGEPSGGSEDYVRHEAARARAAGVDVRVTGRVPPGRVAAELADVGVPVCLFRNVSASGSLATWVAAGRRPLVFDGPYTREVERRWPGSVLTTTPERLGDSLAGLIRDPGPTYRSDPVPAWGAAEVARAHHGLWAGVTA